MCPFIKLKRLLNVFIIIIIIIFTLRNKPLVGYMIKAYKIYLCACLFAPGLLWSCGSTDGAAQDNRGPLKEILSGQHQLLTRRCHLPLKAVMS